MSKINRIKGTPAVLGRTVCNDPPLCPCTLQVDVTDTATGKAWYFAAGCWLDAARGDGATERLLLASDTDPWADKTMYKVGRMRYYYSSMICTRPIGALLLGPHDWIKSAACNTPCTHQTLQGIICSCALQVTVFTSSKANAGSTASLSVTLYGSKGPPITSTAGVRRSTYSAGANTAPAAAPGSMTNSGRCELKAVGNEESRVSLAAGSSCSFMLPSMPNLGQLRQLLLEADTCTKVGAVTCMLAAASVDGHHCCRLKVVMRAYTWHTVCHGVC